MDLVRYGFEEFDWRGARKKLNRVGDTSSQRDGSSHHFIREGGARGFPRARSALMSHGWAVVLPRWTKVIGLAEPGGVRR